MGKEIVRTGDQDRINLAWHLHSEVIAGEVGARREILRSTIALKRIHDEKLYLAMGHETFEDYAVSKLGIQVRAAYSRLDQLKGLTEDHLQRLQILSNPPAPAALARFRSSFGADSESLAAYSADDMEAFLCLSEAEQQAELDKMRGYDRKRDGGRGPSDLERPLSSVHRYRDQSRKLHLKDQLIALKDGENEELKEQNRAKEERIEQLIEAIKDPNSAKLLKTLDYLTTEVAKLKKAEAEAEAEIAVGKEVGTRALILSGEIQALLGQFEDSVRIDKKAQWVEVRAILHSAQDAIEQTLGRMAEVIIARVDSGEITRFSVEDPEGESGAAAEGLSEPRRRLKAEG